MNLQIRKDSIGEAREQLIYTDGVLGALFARLRKAGKYDRSTIVLTSDHTWRRNPDVPYGKGGVWSHVPLLVKYPGQRTRLDIRAPFSTSR